MKVQALLLCLLTATLSVAWMPSVTRPIKHKRAAVRDEIVVKRQVLAADLRPSRRQTETCPTPLPSGGCNCGDGNILCSGSCVSSSSLTSCGTCTNQCFMGDMTRQAQACVDGECVCADPYPDACNGGCSNFNNDHYNCGSCDHICPGECVGGICANPCPAGDLFCNNDMCVTNNTIYNCGSCGSACLPGDTSVQPEVCTAGVCACPAGYPTICGEGCTNLLSDHYNCGSCDHICPGECVGGICANPCPAGDLFCNNDMCVTNNTQGNCGSCGNACLPGDTSVQPEVCTAGVCACPAGYPTICGEGCTNLLNDHYNCGSCDHICPGECVGGICANPCPAGDLFCNNDMCVTNNTINNCGSCGSMCLPGDTSVQPEVCTAGVCACPAGYPTICGEGCTNLLNDHYNCGSCDHICPGECVGGICANPCPAGYLFCNGDACFQNNTLTNCGSCGNACFMGSTTLPAQVCTNGACV
ncbi:hypothetical protein CALVIDRAFT_414311 [Calocera viscosa TUFC12733]|uniref:Uncharacterized protein n=1 Tax=Calocera viscosa (strain TUFC12733) TaxID=1330018 RepID=A0A167G1R3_CALVF|nr:hypothetical protein CALVIDRAFT_414311 [Calocera viscosa TUFC12733]